jgi:hypothetical protein
MATEAAKVEAQVAIAALRQCSRKAEKNNAKLSKEIATQVHKRKRAEDSMEEVQRDSYRQQRLSNKHDRQLQIDKAASQHQQSLCLSMSDRLVYEQQSIRDKRQQFKKSMCAVTKGLQVDTKVSPYF